MRELLRRVFQLSVVVAALAVAAGCGGGGSSSSGSSGGGAAAGTPQKGGTLTILASSSFGVADPAQNYTLEEWQFLIDTHDGLVQFKRVGGSAGTQLVPDLAESIPQPTTPGSGSADLRPRPDLHAQRDTPCVAFRISISACFECHTCSTRSIRRCDPQ